MKGNGKQINMHLLAVFLIILISVAMVYKIIFSEGLILYADFTLPLTIDKFFDMHYPLWNQYGSLNTFEFISRLAFRGIPFLIGMFFGMTAENFYKLMVLSTIILSGISMYFAFFYLIDTSDKYNRSVSFAAIIASLIYMLNFKAIQTIIWPTLHFVYAIAPIALVVFIKLLNTRSHKQVILLALLLTLLAGSPHYLIFTILLMFLWMLFYTIKNKKNIVKSIKISLLCAAFFLLLNLFWILPYVTSSVLGATPAPEYVVQTEAIDMLSRNSEIINTFRLSDIWWQHSDLKPENSTITSFWIIASFSTVILGFSSLLLYKKKHTTYTIFFSLASLLLILLATGTNNNFSSFYSWMSFNLPLGWLLRSPNKITMILSMTYSFLCGIALLNLYENNRKKATFFATVFLVFLSITIFPMASGYLYGVFTPTKIPTDYYDVNKFISNDSGEYKALWLPLEYSGGAKWAPEKLIGPIDIRSSSIPTISTLKLSSKNYLSYLVEDLAQNRSHNIYKMTGFLNIRYILYHNDLENENGKMANLALQKNIISQKNNTLIDIYENRIYANHTNIPLRNHLILDSLNKITTLNTIQSFNPINHSLFFLEKSIINDKEDYIKSMDDLITHNYLNTLTLSLLDERYLIIPYASTIHFNPTKMWSKAATNDPSMGLWHPYLEKRNIENWDFDYGKGIVFTWSNSIIDENVNPSEKDLLSAYYFENSFDEWDVNGKDIQNKELSNDSHSGKHSFLATLNESKKGWKNINSPLLHATYSITYKWIFNTKAENAQNVHVKIVEYDIDKKIINSKQVASLGTGTLGWKEVSFEYKPTDRLVTYMQLQIWHGHETKQSLPNKVWIDDVKVYDLTKYIDPVAIEMNANVDNNGKYELFVRDFKNKDGGIIDISMDGEIIRRINTYDQLNKFVWEKVTTLNLKKGKHKLTLTNADGFNAVNIFALVPEKEYRKIEAKTESLLEGKRLIYIFEAESDLYRTDAPISNKYGGEASNGEVLEFNNTSKAWQTVSITRADNYTIGLKLKGDFYIKVNETNYNLISNDSDFSYIGPFYFEKGDHKIEIILKTNRTNNSYLDVVWLYSSNHTGETLDDVFTIIEKPSTVSNYTKINPTLYEIKVNATNPFMLSFAESYDPLWYAQVTKINGKPLKSEMFRPVPLYSVINGFWINQTGDLDITIEYEPQKWFYVGAAVSLTTLFLSSLYLIYDWHRNRRMEKGIIMPEKRKQ